MYLKYYFTNPSPAQLNIPTHVRISDLFMQRKLIRQSNTYLTKMREELV